MSSLPLMQQQRKIIQKLYNRIIKLQFSLDSQLKKLQNILLQLNSKTHSKYHNQHHYGYIKSLNHKSNLSNKQIPSVSVSNHYSSQCYLENQKQFLQIKKQIETILQQCQPFLQQTQPLSNRYLILRSQRLKLQQQNTSITTAITNNNLSIIKCKKLQQQLSKLSSQYQSQYTTLSQLKMIYATNYRQQKQMSLKLQSTQAKQYYFKWKLDKQKVIQIDASNTGLLKDNQKFDQLLQQRDGIQSQILSKNQQKHQQYNSKYKKKSVIQLKIKSIDQVSQNMVKTITEQQKFINKIATKQKISVDQLCHEIKTQFDIDEIDKWGNNQNITKKLKNLKSYFHFQDTFNYPDKFLNHQIQKAHKSQNKTQRQLSSGQFQTDRNNTNKKCQQSSYILPHTFPHIPSNFSHFPKLKPNQSRNIFFSPTNQNSNHNSPKSPKSPTMITQQLISNKSKIHNFNTFPKGLLNQLKYSQLKKNIRIRTKNGYQYYHDDLSQKFRLQSQQDRKKINQFNKISPNRQRLEIVKIYDKIVNQNPQEKPQSKDDHQPDATSPLHKGKSSQKDSSSDILSNQSKIPFYWDSKSKTPSKQPKPWQGPQNEANDPTIKKCTNQYQQGEQNQFLTNPNQFEKQNNKKKMQQNQGSKKKRLNTIQENQDQITHYGSHSRNR